MNVAVFGLGKLGLPLATVLATKGHFVYGVDNNLKVLEAMRDGICPVEETDLDLMFWSYYDRKIVVGKDVQTAVENSEIIFIVVPTPSKEDGSFSTEYVVQAGESIGPHLGSGKLVVLVSTVMPGGTQELVDALERTHPCGGKLNRDFGAAYNPEFIALGSVIHNMLHPDFILIGESEKQWGNKLELFYDTVINNVSRVTRMNFVSAEIAKLALNCYVTTKISYANMLSELCDKTPGADVFKVTKALGMDSRIGIKYLCPGTAWSGVCFPRDNIALMSYGTSVNLFLDLPEATVAINDRQTDRLASLIRGRFPQGATISVLGLTYKCNTPNTEESAGVHLVKMLRKSGYLVREYDPLVAPGSLISCCGAECIVVMLPYAEFSHLPPECAGSAVIDPWGIVKNENVVLIRPGVGK